MCFENTSYISKKSAKVVLEEFEKGLPFPKNNLPNSD